jgi:hypothetical protein
MNIEKYIKFREDSSNIEKEATNNEINSNAGVKLSFDSGWDDFQQNIDLRRISISFENNPGANFDIKNLRKKDIKEDGEIEKNKKSRDIEDSNGRFESSDDFTDEDNSFKYSDHGSIDKYPNSGNNMPDHSSEKPSKSIFVSEPIDDTKENSNSHDEEEVLLIKKKKKNQQFIIILENF